MAEKEVGEFMWLFERIQYKKTSQSPFSMAKEQVLGGLPAMGAKGGPLFQNFEIWLKFKGYFKNFERKRGLF